MKQRLKSVLVIVSYILLIVITPPLPSYLGKNDFQAYWSASYLLARSENFSDPERLLQVERDQTDVKRDDPLQTWNPPWLLVLLIPYTFIPFARASWWWLLTNIALIYIGSMVAWHQSANRERTRRWGWIAPLIAFAFIPVLLVLALGQVSTLVFAGLALFLFFEATSPIRAGIALALTTVKPHLVYVTLPLILLDLASKRRWRLLIAFGTTLISLTAFVFLLRPTFLSEYTSTIAGGRLLLWETPTLGGILHKELGWGWVRLAGLIILPLAVIVWWRQRSATSMSVLLEVTLLVSFLSAPSGWSFDFVVLLLPLLSIAVWLFEGDLGKLESTALVLLLLAVYGLSFYQRLLPRPREVYFFWIPWLIAGVYFWTRARLNPRAHPAKTVQS